MAKTGDYYSEPHRPQVHFSPEKSWMNDPNGMVYYEGEYHLFYQYYPDGLQWGPMHWGHAITKDLVHWEHLPIALFPDSLGLIFSGSAVVDWKNTTGFGINGKPPLVAMFTHHKVEAEKAGRHDFQYQSLAYSNDKGRTWTKYAGNPVIPNPNNIHDFRDTKVFWHEESQRWVVVLAAGDHVEFYNSPDLKSWTKTGEFGVGHGNHGGVWECPDLFRMNVEGIKGKRWVLLQSIGTGAPNGGSGTQYFFGEFDGKTFINENPASEERWLDFGCDNYAGVTWSNAPDGRRLFIGWMSNWQYAQKVPTAPWRSAMTTVCELTMKNTRAAVLLSRQPVKELDLIKTNTISLPTNEPGGVFAPNAMPSAFDMELNVNLSSTTAKILGYRFSNSKGEELRVGYERTTNRWFIDRRRVGKTDFSDVFAGIHYAPRAVVTNDLQFRLVMDVSSVELFADGGSTCMTDLFFPSEPFTNCSLFAEGGTVSIKGGTCSTLKRIWGNK